MSKLKLPALPTPCRKAGSRLRHRAIAMLSLIVHIWHVATFIFELAVVAWLMHESKTQH